MSLQKLPLHIFLFGLFVSLVSCADLEHKMDVALYGSEEKAEIARKELAAANLDREIQQQRKMEKKTFELINDTRKLHNLQPVPKDEKLQFLARIRAKEISDGFDEYRPDNNWVYGEFRLSGLIKPESIVYTWMTDIESRKTLLDPALTRFGVGVFKKGGTHYWVLVTQD